MRATMALFTDFFVRYSPSLVTCRSVFYEFLNRYTIDDTEFLHPVYSEILYIIVLYLQDNIKNYFFYRADSEKFFPRIDYYDK